jgi:Ca-activated chloride channel family protein
MFPHIRFPWRRLLVAAGPVLFAIVRLAPGAGASAPQQLKFSARTQGVLVDVDVRRGGSPYPGLTAADFELSDNGVAQEFDVLTSADTPIGAVLVFDASASATGTRRTDLISAGRALLAGLRPGDSSALTTFNVGVTPVVPLTSDLDLVRSSMDRVVPVGSTSLLDGLYAGLMATAPAVGASLVVVCTDGVDTASWLEVDEVVDAAKRLNAVLDAVVVKSKHPTTGLKEVVEATGGEITVIDSTSGLADLFVRILHDFRNRYRLQFTPRGVEPGGFHRLEVRVNKPGLTVRARSGYISDRR